MDWYLQICSFSYNLEHGIVPAALPQLRRFYTGNSFEEAAIQCVSVVGTQLGVMLATIWELELRKNWLAVAMILEGVGNVGSGFMIKHGYHKDARLVGFGLYALRFASGFLTAYAVHCFPKWINKSFKLAGAGASKQALLQLFGVVGTITGYCLVAAFDVHDAFIVAGACCVLSALLSVFVKTFQLGAYAPAELTAHELLEDGKEAQQQLLALASPHLSAPLFAFLTDGVNDLGRKDNKKSAWWFQVGRVCCLPEFVGVTMVVWVNTTVSQALAYWMFTIYQLQLRVNTTKALVGVTLIFAVGTILGLFIASLVKVDANSDGRANGVKVHPSTLLTLTIFSFLTTVLAVVTSLQREFWPLTLFMMCAVICGASTIPISQATIHSCCLSADEDVAYGLYQFAFQSSWFIGPLLPVGLARLCHGTTEKEGITMSMYLPALGCLVVFFAYLRRVRTANLDSFAALEMIDPSDQHATMVLR